MSNMWGSLHMGCSYLQPQARPVVVIGKHHVHLIDPDIEVEHVLPPYVTAAVANPTPVPRPQDGKLQVMPT